MAKKKAQLIYPQVLYARDMNQDNRTGVATEINVEPRVESLAYSNDHEFVVAVYEFAGLRKVTRAVTVQEIPA